MKSETLTKIVCDRPGISLAVNEGTEFEFPAFETPDLLDQAEKNCATLAGYDTIADATRNIPPLYKCPGENTPDGDTDPVIALRRRISDGPLASHSCASGDELQAAELTSLIKAVMAVVSGMRTGRFVGIGGYEQNDSVECCLIHEKSTWRLAMDILCAPTVVAVRDIKEKIEAGDYDDPKRVAESAMYSRRAIAISAYARATKKLRDERNHQRSLGREEASYRRSCGTDETTWPAHIRERLAGLQMRSMSEDTKTKIHAEIVAAGKECRAAGVTPSRSLIPHKWADYDEPRLSHKS